MDRGSEGEHIIKYRVRQLMVYVSSDWMEELVQGWPTAMYSRYLFIVRIYCIANLQGWEIPESQL